MKGQFFISSVVVIGVILIVSMTYANSAEELRIDTINDLEFDNYRNAYKDAVPDDWALTDYVSRNKVGVCVNDSVFDSQVNTSVQFTVNSNCEEELNSSVSIEVSSSAATCYLLIIPNSHTFDSQNCTSFYVYYNGPSGNIGSDTPSYSVNGTKFDAESINISPHDHVVSDYREKNILVNETSSTNKVYNVSYQSDRIDYTGQL